MSASRPEVAFVVQRYGEGITGGSESLARAVAERLASDYRITVFTSCAQDYVTWRNELPAGLERLGGPAFPGPPGARSGGFQRFRGPPLRPGGGGRKGRRRGPGARAPRR